MTRKELAEGIEKHLPSALGGRSVTFDKKKVYITFYYQKSLPKSPKKVVYCIYRQSAMYMVDCNTKPVSSTVAFDDDKVKTDRMVQIIADTIQTHAECNGITFQHKVQS